MTAETSGVRVAVGTKIKALAGLIYLQSLSILH